MSIFNVFHHDLLDVRRSRLGTGVLGVNILFMVVVFVGATNIQSEMESVLAFVHLTGTFVVPLTALVAAAVSIAGDRESGRIRFLLGFPNSRRDVVIGTFLSRTVLVGGSLLAGFAVVALLGVIRFDRLLLGELVTFGTLTLLFTIAYVGLAVGLSSTTSNPVRAVAATVGSFLVLNVFWGLLNPAGSPVAIVRSLLEVQLGLVPPDSVYVLAEVFSPVMAYTHSLQILGPVWKSSVETSSAAPHLASPALAIGVLAMWTVIPLVLGFWRFRRAEIN